MTSRHAADLTVPLLDLTAQYRPIRDDVLRAITRVCDSQRFIGGPEIEALERELAPVAECEHAVAVSSGTDALLVTMMALGIGPGAEVITPTYSFFATAGSVSRLGATPVFVDIDSATFNADPDAVARAITPRTRAILPVHLFGLCADMAPILAAAARAGVPVIEDAAQAIGARYRGRAAGSFGLAACFSFFPSKNLGAFGDGGMVTTNDAAFAREIRLLRDHGAEQRYYHRKVGGNFRLDALQAAVLRVKALHLDAWTEARRRNADRYRALVDEYRLAGDVELPIEPPDRRHIYNQFVILGRDRDALKAHLAAQHVSSEIYYPVPLHRQECFAALGVDPEACPAARRAAASSLALPIYGELTELQQRHVVEAMAAFYASRR